MNFKIIGIKSKLGEKFFYLFSDKDIDQPIAVLNYTEITNLFIKFQQQNKLLDELIIEAKKH